MLGWVEFGRSLTGYQSLDGAFSLYMYVQIGVWFLRDINLLFAELKIWQDLVLGVHSSQRVAGIGQ